MPGEFQYNYGDCYGNDRFVRMRFALVRALLAPRLKAGIRLLDIGCYDGALLEALKGDLPASAYVGVDADETALAIAGRRGGTVHRLNFEHDGLPFADATFDVVVLAEILEHLRDPARLLAEARRVLKPDGTAIVSLPNECTLYHRLKVLAGIGIDGTGFEPGYHLHFPTLPQGRAFISRFFQIQDQRYWYHLGVGGLAEKALALLPHRLWQFLVERLPGLLARGGIYRCSPGPAPAAAPADPVSASRGGDISAEVPA